MWFSDFSELDDGVKTTIAEDSPLRTYMDINIHSLYPQAPDKPIDIYGNHPWKHPGKAPVWSPCVSRRVFPHRTSSRQRSVLTDDGPPN